MRMYWTTSLTILFLTITGIAKIHAGRANFPGRDDMGPRIADLLKGIEVGKREKGGTDKGSEVRYPYSHAYRKNFAESNTYEQFIGRAKKALDSMENRTFVASRYTETVRSAIVEYCYLANRDSTWPEEYKGTNIPLYSDLHKLFYRNDMGVICKGFAEHCGGTASDKALENNVPCTELTES